ncbi:MAG: HPP family protein [Chloroflexota bacterium]|nr:HPP family protein [Chloroflexota bacterium]
MHILDRNFKSAWRNYVVQCTMAVAALVAILFLLDVLTHAAVVAALGASTFIAFTMPRSLTAQPRNIIGGHTMGLIAGTICYFVLIHTPMDWAHHTPYILAAALSVGLSTFLMVITDTEHPPAAGTALGIVVGGWSPWTALFVMLFAIALSLVTRFMKPWLKELIG